MKKAILGVLLIVSCGLLLDSCGGHTDHVIVTPGTKGDKGDPGADGAGCTQTAVEPTAIAGDVAQYGGSIITCGQKNTFIHNGSPGIEGDKGDIGAPGATGQAGTSITAVQFCPNAHLVYPTSFPEIGFCFNGDLYAVYWDRANLNAWLTEIPPGYYASTSTSAPCNFTVIANCGVR